MLVRVQEDVEATIGSQRQNLHVFAHTASFRSSSKSYKKPTSPHCSAEVSILRNTRRFCARKRWEQKTELCVSNDSELRRIWKRHVMLFLVWFLFYSFPNRQFKKSTHTSLKRENLVYASYVSWFVDLVRLKRGDRSIEESSRT